MDLTPEMNKNIGGVTDRAEHFLRGVDPEPFSPAAFSVLKDKITQHVSDLIEESTAVARRDKADSISTKHVEVASEHLITHAGGRVYQLLGTWGGIFLGSSSSAFVSMFLSHQFPASALLFGIIAGVAGAFLLGLSTRN
ncbi:MAG: hypothetical protein QOH41_4146 [Blastocatellia bacterium]|jgi:hypothetical protein|nr:hypothetical protein [Blastocatellia bacterium]